MVPALVPVVTSLYSTGFPCIGDIRLEDSQTTFFGLGAELTD